MRKRFLGGFSPQLRRTAAGLYARYFSPSTYSPGRGPCWSSALCTPRRSGAPTRGHGCVEVRISLRFAPEALLQDAAEIVPLGDVPARIPAPNCDCGLGAHRGGRTGTGSRSVMLNRGRKVLACLQNETMLPERSSCSCKDFGGCNRGNVSWRSRAAQRTRACQSSQPVRAISKTSSPRAARKCCLLRNVCRTSCSMPSRLSLGVRSKASRISLACGGSSNRERDSCCCG